MSYEHGQRVELLGWDCEVVQSNNRFYVEATILAPVGFEPRAQRFRTIQSFLTRDDAARAKYLIEKQHNDKVESDERWKTFQSGDMKG
jgi:hypothetical protein